MFLKNFSMNANNGPSALKKEYEEPGDPEDAKAVSTKIQSIKALESVMQDRILGSQFNLYNAHVKLNVEQRIDMAERVVVNEYRNEIK